MIPVFDLQVAQEDLDAVAAVLRAGALADGERTRAFEEAMRERLGCAHVVAVASCTAALHLAYLGVGCGPGDEVVTTAYTFAATANAVRYTGATPVFADVLGPHDLSIDPADVERRITERTKAVCAVHFAGYPARVDELRALCDRRGIALIEDTAHAPVGDLHGRSLGTWGAAGCFSLFSNKVLAAGEGGFLATDDDAIAEQARRLRSHGVVAAADGGPGWDVPRAGFNHRVDDARMAFVLSRLGRLDDEVAGRRDRTRRYRGLLAGVDGVSVPYADEQVDHASCYVLAVLVDDADRRGAIRVALRERHGVQTSLLYPATHRFTAYEEVFGEVSLPRTEDASDREITLPLFGHLTDAQMDHVVGALAEEVAA